MNQIEELNKLTTQYDIVWSLQETEAWIGFNCSDIVPGVSYFHPIYSGLSSNADYFQMLDEAISYTRSFLMYFKDDLKLLYKKENYNQKYLELLDAKFKEFRLAQGLKFHPERK